MLMTDNFYDDISLLDAILFHEADDEVETLDVGGGNTDTDTGEEDGGEEDNTTETTDTDEGGEKNTDDTNDEETGDEDNTEEDPNADDMDVGGDENTDDGQGETENQETDSQNTDDDKEVKLNPYIKLTYIKKLSKLSFNLNNLYNSISASSKFEPSLKNFILAEINNIRDKIKIILVGKINHLENDNLIKLYDLFKKKTDGLITIITKELSKQKKNLDSK